MEIWDRNRIYVCHTFYHVYVTFLKELKLRAQAAEEKGNFRKATLLLSKMSIDFKDMKLRAERSGIFECVMEFDEKREDFFPELAKYRKNTGNFIGNLMNRIRFTRRFAALEAPYIPVNFREYDEIYVYCDSDPIGYYLNRNRIRYHAMEDGLNCIKNSDDARYDNRDHFQIKAFLSERLNLIFVQNGYGKYCIDMEVNDISVLKYKYRKYVEKPIKALTDRLTADEKELILQTFVRDLKRLKEQIAECESQGGGILILTEPLCTLDIRERIFRDIIQKYEKEGKIFLKPHPRDALDYDSLFAEYPKFDASMPMEMFLFLEPFRFKKAVGVLTELTGMTFAEECVRLGPDFMDRYETPAVHRQNEQI